MKVEFRKIKTGYKLEHFKPGDTVKMIQGPYAENVFLVVQGYDCEEGERVNWLVNFAGSVYDKIYQLNHLYVKVNGKVIIDDICYRDY